MAEQRAVDYFGMPKARPGPWLTPEQVEEVKRRRRAKQRLGNIAARDARRAKRAALEEAGYSLRPPPCDWRALIEAWS